MVGIVLGVASAGSSFRALPYQITMLEELLMLLAKQGHRRSGTSVRSSRWFGETLSKQAALLVVCKSWHSLNSCSVLQMKAF